MKKTKYSLTEYIRQLAVIAVPIAMQNLLNTTQSLVDTMMIAPMGEGAIASVGLCASYAALLFACYWGFACGGTLFFAQYHGANDAMGIKKNFGVTFCFMLLVGIIFASFGFFAPTLVMQLYTDKTSLFAVGEEYLRIVAPSYLFQIYSVCLCTLLRSTERVKVPFAAGLVATASNITLNYIFIYGKLGFTAMGASGAALGTLLASAINVAFILILSKIKGYKMIFEIRDHYRWDRDTIKIYLSKCFPIICNELFMGISTMIISAVLGRQTEKVIAALVVFRVIESCIIAFFSGFSNAGSVLVGKCVGAGEMELAKFRATRLVPINAVTISIVGGLLYLFHPTIFHAMGLYGETFEICKTMMVIYIIAAIIRMSNWIQNDTYRSAGDPKYGTILEITFMYLMVLPLVYLTGMVWKSDIALIFAACYVDEPIRFVLMQIHMYSYKWIKPVTEKGKAALDG